MDVNKKEFYTGNKERN